jgi:hypothetical protein
MMNTQGDLQGNINLQDTEGGRPQIYGQAPPMAMGGMAPVGGAQMPPQQNPNGIVMGPKKPGIPAEFRNLHTLDEPVCETIVSDLGLEEAIPLP